MSLNYGWELVAFKTAAASVDKTFGHNVKVSTFTQNSNEEPLYGLGGRDATQIVTKQFNGTCTVDFVVADGWWLRGVTGAAPADGGAAPYTHTYTPAATVQSLTLDYMFDLDTDKRIRALGAKVQNMTLTANVNEPIRCSLEMPFATASGDATVAGQVAEAEEAFVFQQASFALPAGTVADLQSCEVTISNSIEMLLGLGSRFATQAVPKQREYTIRLNPAWENAATLLELMWGAAGGPAAVQPSIATGGLTLTNGEAGTLNRSFVFSFADLKVDSHELPSSCEELVKEGVTLKAMTLTDVVYSNNTLTAL